MLLFWHRAKMPRYFCGQNTERYSHRTAARINYTHVSHTTAYRYCEQPKFFHHFVVRIYISVALVRLCRITQLSELHGACDRSIRWISVSSRFADTSVCLFHPGKPTSNFTFFGLFVGTHVTSVGARPHHTLLIPFFHLKSYKYAINQLTVNKIFDKSYSCARNAFFSSDFGKCMKSISEAANVKKSVKKKNEYHLHLNGSDFRRE